MKSGIRYEVTTLYFDTLLENAVREGFTLYDIEKTGEKTHELCVSARERRRFEAFLREYAVRSRITGKRGAPQAAAFWKAHPVLVGLSLAALLAVLALSRRIWIIEADEPIRAALSRMGVVRGISKASVSESALSRRLSAQFPECAFIAVDVRGVYLTVDARYEKDAPDIFRLEDAANLVACADGIIENVFVQAGSACVQPGDTVKKGQILILGEERAGKDGETVPVQAKGTVTARVWTQAEACVSTVKTEKHPTGSTAVETHLQTPFFTRPLSGSNPFALSDVRTETVNVIGLFLPVTVKKNIYTEYTLKTVSISAGEAERAAGASAAARARARMKADAKEQKLWINVTRLQSGAVRAQAVIEWIQEIAE